MVTIRATDNFGDSIKDLDVQQDGGLFVDVSAIESGDIGEVFGVSSQEFLLPGTDKNNEFFGNMFDIGAAPTVALNYTIYASVLVDGAEVFNGRLYINDVLTDDEGYVMYKAVVINETVDFKTRITDLSLSDLDLSQYDHIVNVNNVTSSWYGNLFSGDIVYPLAEYGTATTGFIVDGAQGSNSFNNENTPLTVDNLKPAIRTKALLDAVFDQVDYNYSSSFFDSDYFERLYILSSPTEDGKLPGTSPDGQFVLANTSGSFATSVPDGGTETLIFDNEVSDNDNIYDPTTGEYTVDQAGRFDITVQLALNWNLPAPAGSAVNRCIIRILVNGSLVQAKLIDTPSVTYRAFFNYITTSLNAGDIITIEVQSFRASSVGSPNTIPGNTLDIIPTYQTSLRILPSVLDNLEVDMSGMFDPNFSVKDFLQGLIEKFNLVIEPKKNERNTLIIEPFDTWAEVRCCKRLD